MDFTSVITHPLGFAGFALFLVFSWLSRVGNHPPPWWPPAAVAMAVFALIGGLMLAYLQSGTPPTAQIPSAQPPAPTAPTQATSTPPTKPEAASPGARPQGASTKVETHGAGSPGIVGGKTGDINITIEGANQPPASPAPTKQ